MEKWLEAFERRPAYLATKSDYYTHVMDIPPQYGPGQTVSEGEPFQKAIDGREGWTLPLPPLTGEDLEPVLDFWNPGDEAARHEAAFCLTSNFKAVAKFAARAAGSDVGSWQRNGGFSKSALADPYAKAEDSIIPDVEACLAHVANALLNGTDKAKADMKGAQGNAEVQKACLEYLRKRISVPRDMSYPAARQFRAHIGWVISQL
eukprot:CAMPEP_0184294938 /NCGR_PEP_ID=MMETSP1049-20130417/5981_1 /TAXON_ID=77928 /ORGANISM="Proteomonas sulcata, Strain CCMP704" /LENGTH=204 /DNA_ID=CAMNT_0026603357 /DNA_START=71 /DNA_END=685 /DNA_ORIENTATION=-